MTHNELNDSVSTAFAHATGVELDDCPCGRNRKIKQSDRCTECLVDGYREYLGERECPMEDVGGAHNYKNAECIWCGAKDPDN